MRAAALELKVNHATVSRRIRAFEQSLGERLFDRGAKGYELTPAARDIYEQAQHLEASLNLVSRRMAAKDQKLAGDLRLTLHDGLAQPFLMQALKSFSDQHSELEFELIDTEQALDLSRREADVALRFCSQPPEHLIGRKLVNVHRACYYPKHLLQALISDATTDMLPDYLADKLNWLGWSEGMRRPVGKIAKAYPRFISRHKIMNIRLQHEACRAGMGVAILPCFIGDADPQLARLPPGCSEPRLELWLLYHPDLRSSKKIQALVHFLYELMAQHRDLFEGRLPCSNDGT